MSRRWLVLPACIAGLALIAGCSTTTDGQARVGNASATVAATTSGGPANGGADSSAEANASTTAAASSTSASARSGSPQEIVLRPVDADGNLAPGFTAYSQTASSGEIQCSYSGSASPASSAVDDDIFACSPNAAAAHTCWATPYESEALCLQDPFEPTLVLMFTDSPMGSVTAPVEAQPLGLELADGDTCALRHGGAWAPHHSDDSLYGAYSCDRSGIIWTDSSEPIDKTGGDWTVLVGTTDGPLQTVAVAKAYYVGTA